jgi:hypothetical protein
MPAFMFEKISSPVRRDPAAQPEKKPRGFMVQLLERFSERRVKRSLHKERADLGIQEDATE